MNKKQLIVAWGIGVIFWGTIIALYIVPFFKKHPKTNPEVFIAFRKIESYCGDYVSRSNVDPREYEKCKKAIALKKGAVNSEFYPADEYYKVLERLGFNLPPLYNEH